MWKKLLFTHKSDQAMLVRGTGLAMLTALYLYGCFSLYYTAFGWAAFFREPLARGLVIPLIDQDLNGAFVLASVAFLALVLITARVLDRPKTADLLIDTETELQKVTWPSWPETVSASAVVIFTTMFMAGLLFVFDLFLRWATGLVLFG